MTFQPMLSATVTDAGLDKLKYPVLVSPKLDGIRAVKRNGVILSRKLKPIRNAFVQRNLQTVPDGLDGELIVGPLTAPDVFKVTTEGVMSKDGDPDFRFYVFDSLQGPADQPFHLRYERLEAWEDNNIIHDRVRVVRHQVCYNAEQVRALEDRYVDQGYGPSSS